MSTVSIVQKVRRAFKDMPDFTRLVGTVDATTNPVTVTVASGEGGKIPTSGARIEWDDATGETGTVVALPGTDQWQILRDDYGAAAPTLSTHATGARILIDPRFEYARISDVVGSIINALWPDIWVPLETTLTYQATNDYYSPTPSDVEDVSYIYQIYQGTFTRYDATFIPATVSDNTNFPRGAIVIERGVFISGTTIYVAYKAIPTVTNLLTRQEDLVTDGVIAQLTMFEEASSIGPSSALINKTVQAGSSLRAGAVLWQQYMDRRNQERIRLMADEAAEVIIRG
jgi:hypothetical protein